MAILNSKQLWTERNRLADEQVKLVSDGKADEARIIEGQIKQLDLTIGHVMDEEEAVRRSKKPQAPAASLGEAVLGPRDQFGGLDVGYKRSANDAVVTVGAPVEIDLSIPSKSPSLLSNFASTLQETAAAGSVSYKRRGPQTGAPATWEGVKTGESQAKAQVVYTWTDAVANKETIAGYVPVSKDSLADYDELMGIINSDLLLDLDEATNAKYLKGTNNTGIVGVLNTPGIQTFTEAVGGLYFEAIRKMRTKVISGARRIPTHVCINPLVKEAIDLYKTETGLYQAIGGDVLWGMTVVEDNDCDGILVYDSFAATRRSVHGVTVEVGYYNDQFIKNELSILAEHTKALQVRYPDAICYAKKSDLDKAKA